MDSIRDSLQHFSDGKFEKRFQKMKVETLSSERVQNFLSENPHVTNEQLDRAINELYQYKTQWDNCDNCPGVEACLNIMKGYQPKLSTYRDDLQLEYQVCSVKKTADERKRQSSLIKSLYVPKEMTQATFDDIHEDHSSRMMAVANALEFIVNVKPGENGRGLYVYGPFGVGKTFLMGAIANELADREVSTLIVYAPDFFRELKNGISDGSYQSKLDEVKQAPVLILDDIGAETMSNWVRDDILGALLQYRMMEKLPTLFTSNFDLDELEHHLSYTQRGGVEKMDELKAKRIMERIRYLNDVIVMNGENKRA
ncbi:primosomal protein DnaI [Evansella cellulosilytica]|uniref:Primosomal DnaI domain protein n=1 Tax=Evansella cellulosilytica (strain ATCC 21833 / DSM 2522 / FERM P-1141 / JCM 9156 / N-4) TaxID=649639 RepID=E6U0K2_EVAC2|nr:primosomal protein DnaI [Evansella cellulosilytica]ADU31447.1 Primosomal DnaI domain protein [Evansella cellulosilytica DSM 2522]